MNGTKILTYDEKLFTVSLALGNFVWSFTIAKISTPILNADFLQKYGLQVDLKNLRLIDGTKKLHAKTDKFYDTPQYITTIDTT